MNTGKNAQINDAAEVEVDVDVSVLRDIGTSTISDALDRLRIDSQCHGIMPLDRSFSLLGYAYTVRYGVVGQEIGTVGDYIDQVGPNQVVAIDNGGRLDATIWGDLLTLAALQRNVAGTVIDGVCRDIGRALEMGYPIFSRGNWMRTGKDRVRMEEVGGAVSIGGIRVEAGDLIVGDADGIVTIPGARIGEVIVTAGEIFAAESQIRDAVINGTSLLDARASVSYHRLQSNRS